MNLLKPSRLRLERQSVSQLQQRTGSTPTRGRTRRFRPIFLLLPGVLAGGLLTQSPAFGDSATPEALVSRALTTIGPEAAAAPVAGLSVSEDGRSASVRTPSGTFRIAPAKSKDSVFRALPDGVQVLSVLRSGERQTTFDLGLPAGATLDPAGQGYTIVASEHGVKTTLGTLAAPWAVDAAGRRVDTSYALAGGVLTQRLHGTGIRYPVVADPKLTYGRGVYLNLWGWEVVSIGSSVYAYVGGADVAVCAGALDWLGPEVSGLTKLLCAVVGSTSVLGIMKLIRDMAQQVNLGTCYQTRLYPSWGYFKVTKASNCQSW